MAGIDCDETSGLINSLGSSSFSALTQWDTNTLIPYNSRLSSPYSWSSRHNQVNYDWLQVDLGSVHALERVATIGRGNSNQYVTHYKIYYSIDASTWQWVLNEDNSERVFVGNVNYNELVERDIGYVIVARYVRIYPTAFVNHMSLRWEVYGCAVGTYLYILLSIQKHRNSYTRCVTLFFLVV